MFEILTYFHGPRKLFSDLSKFLDPSTSFFIHVIDLMNEKILSIFNKNFY